MSHPDGIEVTITRTTLRSADDPLEQKLLVAHNCVFAWDAAIGAYTSNHSLSARDQNTARSLAALKREGMA